MIEYDIVSMSQRGAPLALLPAPGRGQYDRRLPRERRLAEQRERLIAATAQALAKTESPSVAEVVAVAGTGRNTFYEYFDDIAHARQAAEARAARLVSEGLRAAEQRTRTPVERFRALASEWFELATMFPAEQLLALRPPRGGGLSVAGAALEKSLVRALETIRASGVRLPDREPLRVMAVAATAEVFARSLSVQVVSAETTDARNVSGTRLDRAQLERVLVDVAVRLLR